MANYVFEEGAITPIQDIVDHAENIKENQDGALSYTSIGLIVQDVWGGKVERAKRGPRKQQRNVYLNLKRAELPASNDPDHDAASLSEVLADVEVPEGWNIVNDKSNRLCYVRPEKWEFNNVRATTEVVVTKSPNTPGVLIAIRAHGCQKSLDDVPGVESMSIKSRVHLAFNYIKNSSFCKGICLPPGESIQVFAPHVTGSFKDLSGDGPEAVKAFSSKCKIFSPPGARCSECSKLLKLHNVKKQRKERRIGIHPKCNKRYLSKEEITLQLNQERKSRKNAEKRAKYWKDKFVNEAVRMEDDHHNDLSAMLKDVPKEKVPEDMICLWEQQKKILQTRSKRGYRWHPK